MIGAKAYAVHSATDKLGPWNFERREVGPSDVQIEILYCGVCHSDIHQARNEWGGSKFPMVPGHEIVGLVTKVGANVTKFKEGDLAGIGCLVDSCHECVNCQNGQEQFCKKGASATYNSFEQDKVTPTYGGYSNRIVTTESFVCKVSDKLPLAGVAPLLCAGITTYSPLRKWKVGKGHKVAVLGLGGLGHMAVKFAVSFGAEVTVLSTSANKEEDARRLGSHNFVNTTNADEVKKYAGYFDFIVDTVSAPHDYNMYLRMLAINGVQICVGLPPTPIQFMGFALMGGNRVITASSIGGLPETQEMLDYCAEHGITSDVEVINMEYINDAYDRILKSDVKYRFVIDMATL
jgi:uncharacterized zinc-type alcohol dehydrogenase-like protein